MFHVQPAGAPADLSFPRKCSTHFVLNIHKLQFLLDPPYYGLSPARFEGRVAPPLRLRAHSFLTDRRTAAAIKDAPVRVQLVGALPPADAAHWPTSRCSAPGDRTCSPVLAPDDAAATGPAPADPAAAALFGAPAAGAPAPLALRRGATNEDVLRLLDAPAVREARLVTLDDAEGAFRGWTSDYGQAVLFNALEQYFVLGGDWCCSSRERNEGRLYQVDPPKLAVPRRGL
jgi:hypothetical protein